MGNPRAWVPHRKTAHRAVLRPSCAFLRINVSQSADCAGGFAPRPHRLFEKRRTKTFNYKVQSFLRLFHISDSSSLLMLKNLVTVSKTVKTIIPTVSTVFKTVRPLIIFDMDEITFKSLKKFNITPPQPILSGFVTSTQWAIDGILSPCCEEVGDISAPVAVTRIFLYSPVLSLLMK